MHDKALQACLARHLEQAALAFRLDDELGTHHGISWSDFVLLATLADGDGVTAPELARLLGLSPSRLVLQLLPLEKTGLVARAPGPDGKRRVSLQPCGRRLLGEARETAAAACADAMPG
jgi:DNA-binding MarR family transcriptional regulator